MWTPLGEIGPGRHGPERTEGFLDQLVQKHFIALFRHGSRVFDRMLDHCGHAGIVELSFDEV